MGRRAKRPRRLKGMEWRTFDRQRGRGFDTTFELKNLKKDYETYIDPCLKHPPIGDPSTLSVFLDGDFSAVEWTNASSVLSSFTANVTIDTLSWLFSEHIKPVVIQCWRY